MKLGKLVKTNVCTSETIRGCYAPICVEVAIGVPVKKLITIDKHKQKLIYKGQDIICTFCRVIGHTTQSCLNRKVVETSPKEIDGNTLLLQHHQEQSSQESTTSNEEW